MPNNSDRNPDAASDDVEAVIASLPALRNGLIPAVAQQWDTGEVLMVAWMDADALRATLTAGRATYFSRSRQELWTKGLTSGHLQYVKEVRLDCDRDTVLVLVDQVGVACHTGTRTCFDAGQVPATVLTAEQRAVASNADKEGSPDE